MITMAEWYFSGKVHKKCVEYSSFVKKLQYLPDYSPSTNKLIGRIVYIDSSCNAVTNIPVEMFLEVMNNRKFTAKLGKGRHVHTSRFHPYYNEKEDNVYLVANRLGYIEITMYHGNIAVLAGLQVEDAIEIAFE